MRQFPRRLFKQYLLLLLVNQMASGLFRFLAALGREMIVANTFGSFSLLVIMVLGGFILSHGTHSQLTFEYNLNVILV